MPQIDTVKALFTYIIATIIVVGGLIFLFLTRLEPGSQPTSLVVAGFIGAALQFVFGSEVQTRTARQQAAAVAGNGHG